MSVLSQFTVQHGGALETTGAANITLTASSAKVQGVGMTAAGLSVTLPVATTLKKGGPLYIIKNTGDFTFNVNSSSGGAAVAVVLPGQGFSFSLAGNSSAAGVWYADSVEPSLEYLSALVLNSAVIASADLQICSMSSTTALVGYSESSNYFVRVLTIASNAVTAGTAINMGNATTGGSIRPAIVRLSDTLAVFVGLASTFWSGRTLTVSGTTVSAGTAAVVPGNYANMPSAAVRLSATTALLMGNDTANYCAVVTVTGGVTCTFGTVIAPTQSYAANVFCDLAFVTPTKVISVNSNSNSLQAVTLTISGTTVTAGAKTTVHEWSTYTSNYNSGVVVNESDIYLVTNNATSAPYGYSFSVADVAGSVPLRGTYATGLLQPYTNRIMSPIIGLRGGYMYHAAGDMLFAYKVLNKALQQVSSVGVAPSAAVAVATRSAIVGNFILTISKAAVTSFATVSLTRITP